ncbi:MAG TPA: hypothetical protein VMT43_12720, partial [Acidimicrobiales bacterium]|nr:hypothetical protein [Acidimicrobiales bacterium]
MDVVHPSVAAVVDVSVLAADEVSVELVVQPVVEVGSPAVVVVPSPVVDGSGVVVVSPEVSDDEDDDEASPLVEPVSVDVAPLVSVDELVGSVAVGSELESVGSAAVVELGSVVVVPEVSDDEGVVVAVAVPASLPSANAAGASAAHARTAATNVTTPAARAPNTRLPPSLAFKQLPPRFPVKRQESYHQRRSRTSPLSTCVPNEATVRPKTRRVACQAWPLVESMFGQHSGTSQAPVGSSGAARTRGKGLGGDEDMDLRLRLGARIALGIVLGAALLLGVVGRSAARTADDPPTVSIAAPSSSVSEGSAAAFPLSLTGPAEGDFTVDYTVDDGGNSSTATATISASDPAPTISVTPADDHSPGPDR